MEKQFENQQRFSAKERKQKIVLCIGATLAVGAVAGGIIIGSNNFSAQAGPTSDKLQDSLANVAETDAETGDDVKVDTEAQVIKSLGEPGKLTMDGATKPSFEVTVHSVKVKKSCTLRGLDETITPKNGVFLVLDVSASLAASAAKVVDEEIALMPLGASSFGASPGESKNITYDLNAVAAYSCEVGNALDIAVGAGDEIRGNVVLDSPDATGQLVYDPDKTGGWTWSY